MISSKDETAFNLSKEFAKSKGVSSQSMLFTNDIGLFLIKNRKQVYDCLSEMMSACGELADLLPENSKMMIQGLQFTVTLREQASDELHKKMNGYGFHFQEERYTEDDEGEIAVSTWFYQLPENYDETFNEFLNTYPDFLKKKYEDYQKTKQGKCSA